MNEPGRSKQRPYKCLFMRLLGKGLVGALLAAPFFNGPSRAATWVHERLTYSGSCCDTDSDEKEWSGDHGN
jgi:hypothetical protein